jgi:hypothetical protein
MDDLEAADSAGDELGAGVTRRAIIGRAIKLAYVTPVIGATLYFGARAATAQDEFGFISPCDGDDDDDEPTPSPTPGGDDDDDDDDGGDDDEPTPTPGDDDDDEPTPTPTPGGDDDDGDDDGGDDDEPTPTPTPGGDDDDDDDTGGEEEDDDDEVRTVRRLPDTGDGGSLAPAPWHEGSLTDLPGYGVALGEAPLADSIPANGTEGGNGCP